MHNYETLLEECNEYYTRAIEAESEVRYLEQELNEANEILDGIEQVLFSEIGDVKLVERIYNKIFHIEQG